MPHIQRNDAPITLLPVVESIRRQAAQRVKQDSVSERHVFRALVIACAMSFAAGAVVGMALMVGGP